MDGRILFVSVISFLSASARQSPGPTFAGFEAVAPGKSLLYVYRSADAIETTPAVSFTLDGKELARTRSGGYSDMSLAPGPYALSVGPDGLNASPTCNKRIELAHGQWLVCGYDSSGNPGSVTWQLACVDAKQAPSDLSSCNLEPLSPDWAAP